MSGKDRRFGNLLARERKGEALNLTEDVEELYTHIKDLCDDIENGVELNKHDRAFLVAVIHEVILPASRRGRHSTAIGPKQYVCYLAELAKADYRKQNRRERVSHDTEYAIFKRAIELVKAKFPPPWRDQVKLESGLAGDDDIRRYNWRTSDAMEFEGNVYFPDASKLMRSAWEE